MESSVRVCLSAPKFSSYSRARTLVLVYSPALPKTYSWMWSWLFMVGGKKRRAGGARALDKKKTRLDNNLVVEAVEGITSFSFLCVALALEIFFVSFSKSKKRRRGVEKGGKFQRRQAGRHSEGCRIQRRQAGTQKGVKPG